MQKLLKKNHKRMTPKAKKFTYKDIFFLFLGYGGFPRGRWGDIKAMVRERNGNDDPTKNQ
jgi:hypothetical protein